MVEEKEEHKGTGKEQKGLRIQGKRQNKEEGGDKVHPKWREEVKEQ